ncbi:hypothetical protein [Kineococcus sp. SYSU DK005]|uniref:hypothetical protein n=1 Tax=Kineococcus sp. SYSU DK005 TaxID=3383126 RepID=UPI003D7D600F
MLAVLLGAAFGALTSLVNAASSHAASPCGGSVLRVLSMAVDSGWAWAGLAVALGALSATRTGTGRTQDSRDSRGSTPPATRARSAAALAGALGLLAATTAYYALDALLGAGPFTDPEATGWWMASALLGPVLGLIGAGWWRTDLLGLLTRLTLPLGAGLQMLVLSPVEGPQVPVEAHVARWLVLLAATAGTAVLLVRHLRARRLRVSAPAA